MLDGLLQKAQARSHERAMRQLRQDCHDLLSLRGEASSPAIARRIIEQLAILKDDSPARKLDEFFELLLADFSPDPAAVLEGAQAYAAQPDAEALIRLSELVEPPRQELFRRINRAPGGTGALIALRHALLERLPRRPALKAVEADLLHLLGSWFNPGFLEMREVSWQSPAQLLEQLIRHEAVHEIDGWDDLRRRLQPDRRCFAFFHPQLPNEPLIFVEVALLPAMADAIAPLIAKRAEPLPPGDWKVAVFYSISNCQPGLRGVSLGNFLIKRVVEQLKHELPQLKTFCTLSPIPGFMAWLAKAGAFAELPGLRSTAAAKLEAARASLLAACDGDLAALTRPATHEALPPEAQQALLQLAAFYLDRFSPQPGGDPVARFHLDNGARLERLNPHANLAAKGLKQSAGMMVNYLYDLARIDTCHERFVNGEVVHSRAIAALL
ncbi:MAG TPA: malonyl-CoA decarboxylase family protein [Ideonella sp.]|uniref:malonyl-CoA decarboxylase domain-containing protein n=1 Tax=Ideonella sp. TaxID=1929293 RepID=UPI002CAAC724|nr:malonyl-CoA decarboxylase family protein [Ideonella sp.]HSI49769.1 malonyl-CoA decarboxylase family protein [Ideonella sp.]